LIKRETLVTDELMIDIHFDFHTDTPARRDPDKLSSTLRRYHQLLWSKSLPNGEKFQLSMTKDKYLTWKGFVLGSDAMSNSYRHRKRMTSLIADVRAEADELFKVGSTIGAYTIFPSNQIDRKYTINQARGVNAKIGDRFDLTLEAIGRHYSGEKSPLSDVLARYSNFFELFVDFKGYVDFFLLQDLVGRDYQVHFCLPLDDFKRKGVPASADDYRKLKRWTVTFVKARSQRITNCF
jgi:hypothetical protein